MRLTRRLLLVTALITLAISPLAVFSNNLIGVVSAYSGSISANPNPAQDSQSITVSCSFTAFYTTQVPGPSGYCVVDSLMVYSHAGASGSGSKTFSPGAFTVASHTMVVYYATSWNVLTHTYIYGSTSATLSVTQGTWAQGNVYIEDPNSQMPSAAPIYGAFVEVSSGSGGTGTVTGMSYTTLQGYYKIPAAGGTYYVSTSAFGYCASPVTSACAGMSSQSFQLTANQMNNIPAIGLYLQSSFDELDASVFWHANLASVYSNFTTGKWGYSDYNVGSPAISVVSTAGLPGGASTPPSGSTSVLKLYGTDQTYTGSGAGSTYAYAYGEFIPARVPLSGTSYIAFNVYDAWTPPSTTLGCGKSGSGFLIGNGMIGIDAHFTDGTFLRTVKDSGGSYIINGDGYRIAPGYELYRDNAPGWAGFGWYRVVADLSELRGKTIDAFALAYDNCNTGGGDSASTSYFSVYFDDIRVEAGGFPTNIVNGGFEQPDLYGWQWGGNLKPRIVTTPTNPGLGSALVGRDPSVMGPGSGVEDSYLGQAFRVPYDGNFQNPTLTGYYKRGTQDSCTSNCLNYVEVAIQDRTTLTTTSVFRQTKNDANWIVLGYSLNSFRGHVLWLTIHVHSNENGYATWGYFDELRMVPDSVSSLYEYSNAAYLQLNTQASRSQSAVFKTLPFVFTYPFSSSLAGSSLGVGIDVFQLDHRAGSGSNARTNNLDFDATALATAPDGWVVTFVQITVKVQLVSGNSGNIVMTLYQSYGENLVPTTGFVPVDPVKLLFDVADGVLTFGAALEIIPGGQIVDLVGAGLFLSGLVYDWATGSTSSQPDPSSQKAQWANQDNYPGAILDGVGTAGGTISATAGIGGWASSGGGVYNIQVTAEAHMSPYSCVYRTGAYNFGCTVQYTTVQVLQGSYLLQITT